MNPETVNIAPAANDKECFFNLGVFMALEAAFKNPEPLYQRNSREHAEMVRAYWRLEPLAKLYWLPERSAGL